jgi:hypothetical protein
MVFAPGGAAAQDQDGYLDRFADAVPSMDRVDFNTEKSAQERLRMVPPGRDHFLLIASVFISIW